MENFWHTLPKPITALAPMDDVTDFVFREIIASVAKPDVLVTEFTSTDGLFSRGHAKVIKKLLFSEKQRPIVAQLWGATPDKFTKAASYIGELGFDGIDINMGCPDKGVMKKKSGAALISDQQLAGEIIAAVKRGAPNLPLSVKTRLAVDQESTKAWLEFLLSTNLDTLILHGRDAKNGSKTAASWDEIGAAVNLKNRINPKITLIGNGDVTSYQEIVAKSKSYGVDGVMVGRGIFHNPWLFAKDINTEHTTKDYLDLLVRHTRIFIETWGSTKNFNSLKKYFKMYVKGFTGADDLRIALMKTTSCAELESVLQSFGY